MLRSELSSHVVALGTWTLALGIQTLLLRKKSLIFETNEGHREL